MTRMAGPNSIPADSLRCEFVVKSGERCKFKHSNGPFCGKHIPKTDRVLVIKLIATRFDESVKDVDLEQMCETPTSRSIVQGFLNQIGSLKTIEQLL
tara:strand:- start:388 stop:678 length:291 start_codon:yes stop_codon:yes gene_type:complete